MKHVGSYACRNTAGRVQRSDHATAQADDLTAITFADSWRIRVANIGNSNTEDFRFLCAMHDGADRYFIPLRGSDYNRQHADHIHFAAGGFMACR